MAELKIEGLGDLTAWVIERLGFKPWAGCGCAQRRAWLNRHTWRIVHAVIILGIAALAVLKVRQ